ncbi:LysR family transcriptional regulator [Paraferrimonas sedimenticola]|uniref:LysR family transcriptional regulator n=1 Tax=Paraferrimonas sedimenticola TaxID=375674 RepID=A0AA37RVB0_9GAMM|nr:LysR family transcriptional regulator [Paraferrimonas sedimenticola]GLP95462.1 LysR family transcriptional regulator [Paraferrimonas sedimenticola]
MLKLELLQSFIAVCETGNVSKAAEQVCRSQSAISLQIKKLEASVGQTLLERNHAGVTVTPAGSTLLEYAYKLVQLNQDALDDLNGAPESTRIRLGVPTDYVNHYLDSCLLEFIREFTDIDLVLETDVSGNLLKKIDNGDLDVAVATHWREPDNGELLFTRRFQWVSAKNSKVLQLEHLPVVLYPENCPIRVQVFANQSLAHKPLRVLMSSPSPQALCMAVENDLAVAPIAEFRINDKMQVLDANEHGLPELPEFNESIYVNPASQCHAQEQLIHLLMSSKQSLCH